MITTILLLCLCFVAHGLILIWAMCRAAKNSDDAMKAAFKADHRLKP